MKEKIKINIISDVVCPWCAVGLKRLKKAIAELDIADYVNISFEPFELNPHMSAEGENLLEHLQGKYGSPEERQKQMQEHITEQGQELGFSFDFFDDMKAVNTRDAHILLEYAKENGKQVVLKERLLTAYFGERKDVSDRDVLIEELQSAGLDPVEGKALFDDDNARYEISQKQRYWQERGVSSVPTMVFNGQNALIGAQPVDVFKKVLSELLEGFA